MTAPTTKPASVAEAIKLARDKCEQYWDEPAIGAEEFHHVLQFIHIELRAALPRAEALEALVEAAQETHDWITRAEGSANWSISECREAVMRRDSIRAALRRVREAK